MANGKKAIVYLGLGSNIGDRMAKLFEAEKELESHSQIHIKECSKIYETEPWPKHIPMDARPVEEKGQDWHLNQVICIETILSPHELLKAVTDIEKRMGKIQKKEWGSREIDIDILLYEDDIIDSPELEIPHRHMADRQFVLVPLLEIYPQSTDPKTGRLYQLFLNEIKDNHRVIPYL